jgi:ABC-2 type transport system permease protein
MIPHPKSYLSELEPVSKEWFVGFYPIYQKELSYWFRNYRWLSQLIIWMSLTAIPAVWTTQDSASDRGISYLTLFIWLSGTLTSIGTIFLVQGTIIEEKLTQTLLWVFAKPLSASGFILGKFASYAVLLGTIALGIPAISVFLVAIISGLPPQVSPINYLIAIFLLYLMVLFNLASTLMLGVIFERTRTVTAIAFFIFLAEASFSTISFLRQFESYSVFALQRHGIEIIGSKFPQEAFAAIGLTIASIIICLFIACQWMKRYEF